MAIKDFFKLIRFPNTLTAISNVLAGSLIVHRQPKDIILLSLISFSLYVFGILLNDIVDIKFDQKHNPHRPLPSKSVSLSTAYLALVLSLLITIILGLFLTKFEIIVILLMIALIITYNTLLKKTLAGSVTMSSIRGLNWVLGLGMLNFFIFLIVFGYFFILTLLANREHLNTFNKRIVVAMLSSIPLFDGLIALFYLPIINFAWFVLIFFLVFALKKYTYLT